MTARSSIILAWEWQLHFHKAAPLAEQLAGVAAAQDCTPQNAARVIAGDLLRQAKGIEARMLKKQLQPGFGMNEAGAYQERVNKLAKQAAAVLEALDDQAAV